MAEIIVLGDGFGVRQEVDNIGWIDLGKEALVIDAHEDASVEKEVIAAIEQGLGGSPVRWILNTHTHYDHVVLNAAFRSRWGAEILNRRSIPADGRWFEGDLRRVHMIPLDSGHSSDDCVIWVPDEKVLFTGDIFGWGLIPIVGSINDDTAAVLLAAYEKLISFEADTVVPGHGPLCTTDHLRRWVEYFDRLRKNPVGASDPPDDMRHWWRFLEWKHERNVELMARSRK